MGAKDSKPVFITYEDAFRRVNDLELKRLKDAFKRSSTLSGYMMKNVFIREVFGDVVPAQLAENIFRAFGGTQKGLGFKDLISGLVLLTRGNPEEKIKFIFGIYANESFSHINKTEMDELILQTEGTVPQDLADLFLQSDQVSFESFYRWVRDHAEALSMTRWLLKDTDTLSMSTELQTPTFYQTLAGVTHLEESDIIELEKQYWQLKSLSKTGRFDMETFVSIVSPPVPESLCPGLFWAFDENQDNHIDFKELACGISACCRGPTVERQKFCFKIFDSDHNGLLSPVELRDMMSAMLSATDGQMQENANMLTEKILEKFGVAQDGSITQEEYLVWAVSHPLPTQFLSLLVQVCHVVLGLRPQSRDEERDVIFPWLSRDEKQGFQQGQTWYLIALPWWRQWLDYLYQQLQNGTIDGSMISGNRPKEITSHSWTNSISLCPSIIRRPSMEPTEAVSLSAMSQGNAVIAGIHSASSSPYLQPKYATVPRSSQFGGSNGGTDSMSVGGADDVSMTQSLFSYHASSNSSRASTPSGSPRVARHWIGVSKPGAIDNSTLVIPSNNRVVTLTNEGGILRRDRILVRGRDYEVVSETLWKALSNWYGKSSLALPRTVITLCPGASPELELYPIHVKLLRYQMVNQRLQNVNLISGMVAGMSASYVVGPTTSPRRYLAYTSTFSTKHTLRQLHDFLTARLKISREDMRLWKLKDEQNMILLEEENKTVEELEIMDNSQILIEVRNKDLTWPEELSQLAKNKALIDKSVPTERGATGLNNLGNTCFMNSALQCMSNTYILTVYFTSGMHLYELNRLNPLGTQGNIAQRYGDLVKDLWSGTAKSIAPLKLRWTIGKYAPCFNGFQQHDSQELLAFVLDRLHEDLNRVHDKPYVELKDSDGRPDEVVAKEAWENHLLRNQSIIVDLFHGQLKSCVHCIECGHTSVKFDPFTFLSLPLPMDSCIHLEITVVCLDESCPVKYGLRVNIDEKYRGLKRQLSDLCGIAASQLLLVDVCGALVRSFPQDSAKVKVLMAGGNLFAYELPCSYSIPPMSVAEEKGIQQSTPTHHSLVPGHSQGGGLSQIQRLHARHQTSSCDSLHPANTSATDSDTEQSVIPNHLGNRAKPLETNDSDLSSPFNGSMAATRQTNSSRNSSRNNSDFAIDPVNSIERVMQSSVTDNDALPFLGFVVAVHRKMIHLDSYFLSSQKSRPLLFGIPMIIPCSKTTTHHSLYQQVWNLVSRLVSPLPPSEVTAPNHAQDCDDSLGYEYPFTLKAVQKDGLTCTWCPWYRFCRGCTIEYGPQLFSCATSYLAVDWEPTALHLRYHASQEKVFVEHESLEVSRRLQNEPIGLDTCLNAFIREEELGEDELYYCSKCKTHRLAAKKLELWSLPPILIIHLKRFQFHNGRWVKSQKIVKFPFRDFDPTGYLVPRQTATAAAETNHCSASDARNEDGCAGQMKQMLIQRNHNNNTEIADLSSCSIEMGDKIKMNGTGDPEPGIVNFLASLPTVVSERGKESRMECANGKAHLIKDKPTAGCPASSRCEVSSADYHNVRYNLYALSCHTGILGGGHYVTYAKNPNNKWYCYNDSSCKEVTEDQVDTNAAYILFYERQDLERGQFMPDITDKEPGVAEADEEFDKEFKRMCVLQ